MKRAVLLLLALTLTGLLGAPARAALFGAGDLRALSDAIRNTCSRVSSTSASLVAK